MRKIILLLILTVGVNSPALALTETVRRESQTVRGVTISPIFRELTVIDAEPEPSATVTLFNGSGQSLSFTSRWASFGALGPLGGIELDPPGPAPVLERLTVTPTRFTVDADQTVELAIKIKDGAALPEGGHYAALVLTLAGESTESDSSALDINKTLTGLFFITRSGALDKSLTLSALTWRPRVWLPPRNLAWEFTNTGNVHVRPFGRVSLQDRRGQELAATVINEESRLALPDTTVTLAGRLRYTRPLWLPGRYILFTTYRADDQPEQTHRAELIVIPPITFLPLLPLLFVLVWRRRRRGHRR